MGLYVKMKRRKKFIFGLVFFVAVLILINLASAVDEWQWHKYELNPVLDVVASTWESHHIGDPWVIYDNGTYHMWYYAVDDPGNARIGYANSTNGISWTKYGDNPVLSNGSAGSYDEVHAHKPSVVLKNGTYYMYYTAARGNMTIALATSTDRINWTKYSGNPVLSSNETWEENALDCPSVMYDSDENIWKMWYSSGISSYSEPVNWNYATSTDGYNWTKYSGNPIASPPNDGSWLSDGLGGTDVLKINNTYHMYYNAFSMGGISRVGYTNSSDGITWNPKIGDLILDLGTSGSWDSGQVYRPNAQVVDGQWKLWYNAKPTGSATERIGYVNKFNVDPSNITVCIDLTQANTTYTLQNNVNTTFTCFNIQANNITLDLNGYNITGDGGASDYGIKVSYNTATIKNGGIYNFGAGIYSTGNTGNFTNLILNNDTKGISLIGNSNNTLTNMTTNSNTVGVYISSSSNNIIQDSNISSTTSDVVLDTTSTNNIFLNTSYSLSKESVEAGSSLIRKWYYRSYVNDTGGNPVSNANLLAYDVENNLIANTTTNSSGWSNKTGLIEYINSGGTRIHYDNYTIYAYNLTYVGNISYNVSLELNKLNSAITVSEGNFTGHQPKIVRCMSLSGGGTLYILSNSLSTTGTCINIQANNITLDLNGFNITGDGGEYDYGINISNYNTTTIRNGGVYNCGDGSFGGGVYLEDSSNNILTNITANSNTNGIYFEGGSNNTLTNITTNSNTIGIFIYLGSNNTLTNINANSNSNDYGIYLSSSSNNIIQNSNISSTTYDVYLETTSTNNIFLNASYSLSKESVEAGSSLIRKWYYRTYVNDTNGANVSNANITAYNSSSNYQFNLTTDATGYTQIGNIIDYVKNGATRTYYSNYTIYASNSSYTTTSHSFNTSLGNNLKDIFTLVPDTTPPSILIVYPSNNTNSSNNRLNINYSVSGQQACWYSNDTMTSNTTLTNCANITSVGWSEGQHNVNVWANDSAGNVNSSGVSFTIDTINPTINFTSLSDSNGSYVARRYIIVNVTSTDTNLKNITINLYNSTRSLINSTATLTSLNYQNISVSYDGTFYLNATSYDYAGNSNSTETRTIFLDSTSPLVTINSPTSGQAFTTSSILFNVTLNENGICLFSTDSGVTNYTMSSSDNINFNYTNSSIADGSYTAKFFCNDTVGNLNNTASVSFTINTASTTPPGGGGGGGGGSSNQNKTYTINESQLNAGYSAFLEKNWIIKFKINNISYELKIGDINNNKKKKTAEIIISSEKQNEKQRKTLSAGEDWKVNLNNDNYYDIYVKLNGISESKANLTIKGIYEKILGREGSTPDKKKATLGEEQGGLGNLGLAGFKAFPKNLVYIIGALVLINLVLFIIYKIEKRP